jgi:hypothetical protein
MIGRPDSDVVRRMAKAMQHRADLSHIVNDGACCVALSEAPAIPDAVPEILCDGHYPGDTPKGPFATVQRLENGQWRLCRDRLGLRPLYYHVGDGFLLFASELKAILASGLVRRRLNLAATDR